MRAARWTQNHIFQKKGMTMNDTNWQSRVTLLVNSCDAYADLWQPFFTLHTLFCAAAG